MLIFDMLFSVGNVILLAITGTTILAPYLGVKSSHCKSFKHGVPVDFNYYIGALSSN